MVKVEKYAKALMDVINSRNIEFNSRDNLIKVDTERKTATFQVLDSNRKPTGQLKEIQYDLLHVGPPCSPVESLRNAAKNKDNFTDAVGWVNVEEKTLQSKAYPNVFAIGDCAGTTNKKTAAAAADQLNVLIPNLDAVMQGKSLTENQYLGYASCPLLVDSKHVILAEFNHAGPIETLPLNQAKATFHHYWITRYFLPWLYWSVHLKGYWRGPSILRKILHLGLDKQMKK